MITTEPYRVIIQALEKQWGKRMDLTDAVATAAKAINNLAQGTQAYRTSGPYPYSTWINKPNWTVSYEPAKQPSDQSEILTFLEES